LIFLGEASSDEMLEISDQPKHGLERKGHPSKKKLMDTLFNLPNIALSIEDVHMAKMVIIIGHSLTYTYYQHPMSFSSKEH
jgi:hypothetical protein